MNLKMIRFLWGIVFSFPFEIVAQDSYQRVLRLDELFQLVDSCSKTVKSYEAAVNVADEAIRVSKNALLPEINFSASASYNGNAWVADRDFSNGQFYSSPHFGNSFSLEVSQVIFAGGAIMNQIKTSQLQSDLARLNLESERQKVRFLLTGYYLDLYKFRNILTVYEKNIEQTKKVIADMKAREIAGIALNNDITRYEVQLQNLLYKKTELLSSIDVYNNQLVTTLSLPTETEIMTDTTLLQLPTRSYRESELQNIAFENSPTLEITRLHIDLNRQKQKIARAGLLPQISLIAGDNLKGPITYEIPTINSNINTWYIGVGLRYSLSNLYKTPKEIARSYHSIRQAEKQHAATQEKVELDVQEAYTHYQNAFELLRTQEKSLQLATENYEMTFNRYMNDLVLIIDLLDADNIKLSAEIQYVNAQINIVYNYYKLQYVIGTL